MPRLLSSTPLLFSSINLIITKTHITHYQNSYIKLHLNVGTKQGIFFNQMVDKKRKKMLKDRLTEPKLKIPILTCIKLYDLKMLKEIYSHLPQANY